MRLDFFIVESVTNPDVTWTDLPLWKQRVILEEAFQEKAYRECEEHAWSLALDYGSVSIACDRCHSDYSFFCGYDEYVNDLCGTIPIGNIKGIVDKDSYSGEVNDAWLEIS